MHSGHKEAFSLPKEAYLYERAPRPHKIESSLSALSESKPHLFRDARSPACLSPPAWPTCEHVCAEVPPWSGQVMDAIPQGCGPPHLAHRVTHHTGGHLPRTYYVSLLRTREMKEKAFVERKAVGERSQAVGLHG